LQTSRQSKLIKPQNLAGNGHAIHIGVFKKQRRPTMVFTALNTPLCVVGFYLGVFSEWWEKFSRCRDTRMISAISCTRSSPVISMGFFLLSIIKPSLLA